MKTPHFVRILCCGISLLIGAGIPVHAANDYTIYYQANDLTNLNPGEDLWQYRYLISGPSLLTDQGFDIFFSVNDGYLTGDLDPSPISPNATWDVLSIQPELLLPVPNDGFFEGYALQDNPSLSDWFIMSFIWRGTGSPRSASL